jgi:DnaA regulatory inactivator Hda
MTPEETKGQQYPLDLGHRPALGDDDFLVMPSNQDPVNWLDRWPDWPSHALAIYGPAGCGKTHLAHVWEAYVKQSGAVVHHVIARQLWAEDVAALTKNGTAVAVEDADAGVDETALLHLFNLLNENGGSLLLTGRIPPSHWSIGLPDLRSRLSAIPVTEVQPPDDALLEALMVKLFHDRQLTVEREVIGYLMRRGERTFNAVRQLVDRIDREALAAGRRVTVPFVRLFLDGKGK